MHSTGPGAALHTGHAAVHPPRLAHPSSPRATLPTPLPLLPLQGMVFTPAAMAAQGIADPYLVMKRAALAGLCFHAYQQVCSCLKRTAFLAVACWLSVLLLCLGHQPASAPTPATQRAALLCPYVARCCGVCEHVHLRACELPPRRAMPPDGCTACPPLPCT